MTARKSSLAESRRKGIRLTVSLLSLAVAAVFLFVILRRW